MIDNSYYVYVHRRATTGEPFYYGRGKNKRAWDPFRNQWYTNVTNKHGRIVEILKEGLSEEESRIEEKKQIKQARERKENITNQTEGGDGISGKAARKIGLLHKKNKTSIFAEGMASLGGTAASKSSKEKGTGFFSLTRQDHVRIGKRAVLNKTGIHSPSFDKRAASVLGARLPWWKNSLTGEHTRSNSIPSADHVRSGPPAKDMLWWINDETEHVTRSFKQPEGYRRGRKKRVNPYG